MTDRDGHMDESQPPQSKAERLAHVEPNLDDTQAGLHPSVFVARSVVLIGDVSVGPESSLWFGVVVRGDVGTIRIGARTNVQDGTIIHADPDYPTTLGNGVTVGHRAVIHGAGVGDGCMIGMGAILLNGSYVGAESIVGAGAVLAEGEQVPERSLVVGVPAKVVRALDDKDLEFARAAAPHYVQLAKVYRRNTAWAKEPPCALT
jgi:carbonic anhydrase/acetyltransferase-like protein (isoleucine patch superfamily)